MKRAKDRLRRVMVIGATPSGIAAACKLSELGIPTLLVDLDSDLDAKLSLEKWKLKSGLPINHAYRSNIIRLMKSPDVRCILPAQITSIKHSFQGFSVNLTRLQTFIDPSKCNLCGKCIEVCPVCLEDGTKAIKLGSRRSIPGRPVIDKRRMPLCQENCPLGVNVQGYIALSKVKLYKEALELIRKDNILPGICGRVCTHPCEAACRRNELDDSVAIRDIKRFLADYEIKNSITPDIPVITENGKTAAVIGSGPAGLAAAADLALYGYQVTLFEKKKKPGGLLRYGIGKHRLPEDILDLEIDYIKRLGVKFKTSCPIDFLKQFTDLKEEFDGVIITSGTWSDMRLGVPGENLEGVNGCISFLTRIDDEKTGKLDAKVAVIGDGNAAFDLARTLLRLGADVTILSWFPENLIPADKEEITAAIEEGAVIKESLKTVEFKGENQRLKSIVLMPAELGAADSNGICWPVVMPSAEPVELEFDMAFVAIGQKGVLKEKEKIAAFKVTKSGYIQVDENFRTDIANVFAAGDAVSGPTSVVEAMASGKKAALCFHKDMLCIDPEEYYNPSLSLRPLKKDYPAIPDDMPSLSRPKMPEKQSAFRKNSFSEVALGFSEPQVVFETERCLQCGVCSECFQCVNACEAAGAINHLEMEKEIIEHAGVVIVADPKAAPSAKGEDVIRAYGPKIAKPDIYAMILRGFASASKAMILLGETLQHKGHGFSFSPPEPGLNDKLRIGVFVCSCNNSLGWLDEMTSYVKDLIQREDVVHAEVISSACVEDGTANIIRTIHARGITRVVLASCVCCPLNFVCSACTEPRSRLKHALFNRTGISRSMVETCNLRGEVLRLIETDAQLAFTRFTGLIDRSMDRTKKLKQLPVLARNYNFTTAVIGASEASLYSSYTLAKAGYEVLAFGIAGNFSAMELSHQNIHFFKGSDVKEIIGSLGDFQVISELNGQTRSMQVGAVVLDEKSRKKIKFMSQHWLPGSTVSSAIQQKDLLGVPFFNPGETAVSGLFLSEPPGINASNRQKGEAAAVHTAAIMPKGPRQSRGYYSMVDVNLCRGCGRCAMVCPYHAISLNSNSLGGLCAVVDVTLCKGCGNCISVCPTNALDTPYRDQTYLEQTLEELLTSCR